MTFENTKIQNQAGAENLAQHHGGVTDDRCVFIVGVSRSGTTLMRNILNRSGSIGITRENHFLGHLIGAEGARYKFKRFGDLKDDENVRRLVDFIYSGEFGKSSKLREVSSHWRWIIRRIDRQVFLQKLLDSDRSERAFFTIMMQVYAERKGKAIMGEKTPAHVRYVSTLMEWFPQGKVIHMMRDPRGIFVSELRRRREEATSAPYKQLKRFKSLFEIYILVQTTLAWLDSANRFQQYKAQYPHNYRLQRFEDLVRDPEEQIRSLCQFLGVEFQGEMLEQEVVSKGFQVGTVGFDSHAADRWKKHIAPWMHTWFRLVLGKTMKQFGYVA